MEAAVALISISSIELIVLIALIIYRLHRRKTTSLEQARRRKVTSIAAPYGEWRNRGVDQAHHVEQLQSNMAIAQDNSNHDNEAQDESFPSQSLQITMTTETSEKFEQPYLQPQCQSSPPLYEKTTELYDHMTMTADMVNADRFLSPSTLRASHKDHLYENMAGAGLSPVRELEGERFSAEMFGDSASSDEDYVNMQSSPYQ